MLEPLGARADEDLNDPPLGNVVLPLVLALHNLEEGVYFPRYLPRVLGRLPAGRSIR